MREYSSDRRLPTNGSHAHTVKRPKRRRVGQIFVTSISYRRRDSEIRVGVNHRTAASRRSAGDIREFLRWVILPKAPRLRSHPLPTQWCAKRVASVSTSIARDPKPTVDSHPLIDLTKLTLASEIRDAVTHRRIPLLVLLRSSSQKGFRIPNRGDHRA